MSHCLTFKINMSHLLTLKINTSHLLTLKTSKFHSLAMSNLGMKVLITVKQRALLVGKGLGIALHSDLWPPDLTKKNLVRDICFLRTIPCMKFDIYNSQARGFENRTILEMGIDVNLATFDKIGVIYLSCTNKVEALIIVKLQTLMRHHTCMWLSTH